MTMIVETGEGVSGANSYAGLAFARSYLSARAQATAWNAATADARSAALIKATAYIDITFGHRFRGTRQFTAMEQFARNFLYLETVPTDGDTVEIGSQVYTFRTTVTVADEVQIGLTTVLTMSNLVYAVNASGGVEGTNWGTGTVANADVSAEMCEACNTVILTARLSGTDGNEIEIEASNTAAIKIDTPLFSGGAEPGSQPLEFPRTWLYDQSGLPVDGIPLALKQATVEYASRALSASLLPDPTYDANGRLVTRESKEVGPIKTETRWTEGGDIIVDRKYPWADRLLRPYLAGAGGVTR